MTGQWLFLRKRRREPQSETVWRQANKYKVPRIAFINKMDINGADFFNVMEMMRTRLHTKPVAITLPIGSEDTLEGIIDVIKEKAIRYGDSSGINIIYDEVPQEYKEQVAKARAELEEICADYDDEIMMKVLEGQKLNEEEIIKALRIATIKRHNPVLCGTAYKNKGVQRLLDAVVDLLPSPLDVESIKGVNEKGKEEARHSSDDEPLSGLAFKVAVDPFVGKLVYFRVYSGSIKTGMQVYNSTRKQHKERISRILRMHSNHRMEIEEAYAGDIVALIGLKETTTGDTLCASHIPLFLKAWTFPIPW